MNRTPRYNASISVQMTTAMPDVDRTQLRAAWDSRDFGIGGTELAIVGSALCEAVGLPPGSRVLDIAPDHGDSALREFPNATFDTVLSLFGFMLAADDVRAAHELMRICKPRGRVGLTSWTPDGFMGRVFAVLGGQAQPRLTRTVQTRWGDEDHLEHLFRVSGCDLHVTRRHVVFRCRSAEHCVRALRSRYSPVRAVFAALSPERQRKVEEDLLFLVDDFNTSWNSAAVVPSEYVEVVVLKK